MVKYPPYSLKVAPYNFSLFPSLKCELCGGNFETDAQVIQETQTIFRLISKNEFETTTKKWVERMEARLTANRQVFSFLLLEKYTQLFSQNQLYLEIYLTYKEIKTVPQPEKISRIFYIFRAWIRLRVVFNVFMVKY